MIDYFKNRPNELFTGEQVVRIFTNKVNGMSLSHLTKQERDRVTAFMETLSEYTMIPIDMIMSKTRVRNVVVVRHIAMWYLAEKFRMGLKNVGMVFEADHSTVIHARNNVEQWMLMPNMAKQEIETLTNVMMAYEGDNYKEPSLLVKYNQR